MGCSWLSAAVSFGKETASGRAGHGAIWVFQGERSPGVGCAKSLLHTITHEKLGGFP